MNRRAMQLSLYVTASVVLLAMAGCQSTAFVTPQVSQHLTAEQNRQLSVWAANHDVIFDPRLHSVDSCPFGFAITASASDRNSREWAEYLYGYLQAKHNEEKLLWRCDCEERLARETPRPK